MFDVSKCGQFVDSMQARGLFTARALSAANALICSAENARAYAACDLRDSPRDYFAALGEACAFYCEAAAILRADAPHAFAA